MGLSLLTTCFSFQIHRLGAERARGYAHALCDPE